MKTTIEIPDPLFRESKARAALLGQSLKTFVREALEAHIRGDGETFPPTPAWRKVFGAADPGQVAAVDAIVERDLGTVDPADWEA